LKTARYKGTKVRSKKLYILGVGFQSAPKNRRTENKTPWALLSYQAKHMFSQHNLLQDGTFQSAQIFRRMSHRYDLEASLHIMAFGYQANFLRLLYIFAS
jgi:hypothetical protein